MISLFQENYIFGTNASLNIWSSITRSSITKVVVLIKQDHLLFGNIRLIQIKVYNRTNKGGGYIKDHKTSTIILNYINIVIYCYLSVDGGHRAVIFDRFRGVQDKVVGEGTHFLIPWVQKPIIFDIRSRPRNVPVATGSKGKLHCLSF